MTVPDRYVHGHSEREALRLLDQARTLSDLLHYDSEYPPGSIVLEAGCGVGAQTRILARKSPKARFISLDISPDSISQACMMAAEEDIRNVQFARGDIHRLPFPDASFDHIYVCFVLEHLKEPVRALASLRRVLKPGGTITVIEGDHGSAFFHPGSIPAQKTIGCLVELQREMGGNALIGRELYPLLSSAGFSRVSVSPRFVYVDDSRPELVEGFTRHTFTAMVEGVRDIALERRMIDSETWDRGISDLYRTADGGGTFCYTFFKARGVKK